MHEFWRPQICRGSRNNFLYMDRIKTIADPLALLTRLPAGQSTTFG